MDDLRKQLQIETDASFLYDSVANLQTDENLKKVLSSLSRIEKNHADAILNKLMKEDPAASLPQPSRRAKIQIFLGKFFGYDSIINNLSNVEKSVAKNSVLNKRKEGKELTGFEHNHLKIIESIQANQNFDVSSGLLSKFEGRHKSVGGNALRAAVLGANDGLVSNLSLVMGVVGAAASDDTVLLTGIAGLLAGAISMALGEWLSVQSSRELNLNQIRLETQELENSPEEEQKELALLYQAKGMDVKTSEELARKTFESKDKAIEALITEELGMDREELGGSAWEAAIASFILFAIGAVIPLFPYFFLHGENAMLTSIGAAIIGLFGIGASITLFTGRSVAFSGLRQVIFGLAAAAVTYGIGTLIGVSIAG
jgi:VIT1/CCC1 family predicted Fe2+/Mn2+ transporter